MTSSSSSQAGRRGLPSTPPPPLGRQRVGRYEVIYPIAQGGMGGVHAGRLSGMAGFEKLVALKVVHPHLSSETAFIRMFLDEARLAARIHHPNVGEIYEVGEDAGMFFMAGELIQGQSLSKLYRTARRQNVKIDHAIWAEIAARTCLGLHKAHELKDEDNNPYNLVHRDVTPKNILVSYDGFVKLIDFGVAFAKDRLSHTEVGTLKGKAGFMAPEQIRGQELDRRSDIFSLGIVLYMLCVGRHPFPGASDVERMHKIIGGIFPKPKEANPNINEELERIILKALADPRDTRYADAADMGRDLERFIKSSAQDSGAATLSEIMNDLFSDERAYHDSQIRRYRATHTEDIDIEAEMKRTLNPPEKTPEDPQDSTESNTITIDVGELDKIKARQVFIWTFLAALLVLGGAAFWFFGLKQSSSNGEEQPQPPTVLDEEVVFHEPAEVDTGAALAAEPKSVKLTFDIRPATATVKIDGKSVTPKDGFLQIPSDEIRHELKVAASGYVSKTIPFTADRDQIISLDLKKRAKIKKATKPPKAKDDAKKKDGLLKRNPYQ